MMDRRAFLASTAAISAGQRLFALGGTESAQPKAREFERRIFDRINEVRVHCGSAALTWNETIWAEASLQSARKAILRFPGHVDPERGDVAERLNARGLGWSGCGENLFSERGYDDPVNLAVVCWWYSAGHRETLLKPDYTESATGVAIGPDHRIYAAQIFIAPADSALRTRKSPADRSRRARESKLVRRLFGRG